MDIDIRQLPIPDWGLECPNCRYPLIGLPTHRCPECGVELDMTKLVKTWHRLRDPSFSGYELPIPDWGLTCNGCGTPLAGWTSHECPTCRLRFDPWPVEPTPDQWFIIDEDLAGQVPLAAVEPLLAAEHVPFAQQRGKVLSAIIGVNPFSAQLRVPREFYYDILWLLQQTRNEMAAARRRKEDESWTCAECGESVPAHFQICWSCEAPRA